jgi:Transposase DDE domain
VLEHRSALLVDAELTAATGYAERDCAIEMLERLPVTPRRRTVAGDKGYDAGDFVARARDLGFTPRVAPNTTNRRSAIDGRTTRHVGHTISQRIGKRIEEPFGWIKTIAGGRKLRYLGQARNRAWFKITAAVYNLIRITALHPSPARPPPGSRSPSQTRAAGRADPIGDDAPNPPQQHIPAHPNPNFSALLTAQQRHSEVRSNCAALPVRKSVVCQRTDSESCAHVGIRSGQSWRVPNDATERRRCEPHDPLRTKPLSVWECPIRCVIGRDGHGQLAASMRSP